MQSYISTIPHLCKCWQTNSLLEAQKLYKKLNPTGIIYFLRKLQYITQLFSRQEQKKVTLNILSFPQLTDIPANCKKKIPQNEKLYQCFILCYLMKEFTFSPNTLFLIFYSQLYLQNPNILMLKMLVITSLISSFYAW